MKAKPTKAVFQLHISLAGIAPTIWRRIQLKEDTKLPQLHRILQSLFNWEDYHLHEFRVGRRIYAVPDRDDALYGRKVMDEHGVPVNAVVNRVGETFRYLYDFGDGWLHLILLEAILLPEAEVFYPRCIAGARNGPPEDCGGAHGYGEYLEALADRKHERHDELLGWRGSFDAEAYSLDAINAGLQKRFRRRVVVSR